MHHLTTKILAHTTELHFSCMSILSSPPIIKDTRIEYRNRTFKGKKNRLRQKKKKKTSGSFWICVCLTEPKGAWHRSELAMQGQEGSAWPGALSSPTLQKPFPNSLCPLHTQITRASERSSLTLVPSTAKHPKATPATPLLQHTRSF